MKLNLREIFNNNWVVGLGTSIILLILCAVVRYIHSINNKRKVFLWLKDKTKDNAGEQFKSTTEISKGVNIDVVQVRNICSRHKKIFQHVQDEDLWSLFGSEPKSVYEKRGPIVI